MYLRISKLLAVVAVITFLTLPKGYDPGREAYGAGICYHERVKHDCEGSPACQALENVNRWSMHARTVTNEFTDPVLSNPCKVRAEALTPPTTGCDTLSHYVATQCTKDANGNWTTPGNVE